MSNNLQELNPKQVLWWFLLEGFIPLGIAHVKTSGTHHIILDFRNDEDTFSVYGPYAKETYKELTDIIKYWDSLDLGEDFYFDVP